MCDCVNRLDQTTVNIQLLQIGCWSLLIPSMLTVYVSNTFVHILEMSRAIAMQCSVLMPLIGWYYCSGKYCHVHILYRWWNGETCVLVLTQIYALKINGLRMCLLCITCRCVSVEKIMDNSSLQKFSKLRLDFSVIASHWCYIKAKPEALARENTVR